MPAHPLATGDEVHRNARWTPADEAARLLINIGGTNADDVGCEAWQQSDNTTWLAISAGTGASHWKQIGTSARRDVDSTKTANFSVVAFKSYAIGTLTAAITATLPATPTSGDWVDISAAPNSNVYNVTIDGNGKNIGTHQGAQSTLLLTDAYASVTLFYDGTLWRIL